MITHTLILAVSTFCNPVSLPEVPLGYVCRDLPNGSPLPTNTNSWRYTFWKRGAACRFDETHQFRETADPAVYVEGDRWYLYPSLGLLWTSDDCGGTWTRVPERERGEYAPAIAKFRGKYYLCTSGGPLSVADRPEGPFRELGKFDLASFGADPQMPSTQDPALLADGDSLYLYWGCCAKPKSLWGVELDPENPLKAKRTGSAVCLMEYDETRYPWLNELIEGCWVFKRGDTYYLTYSTANTCGPKYAWCASKGKAPLGPFTPQKRNPFFVTEKGLVTGTGHGSIWRDSADRWWISSCTIVGAYHGFERLIAVDRLFFEADGDIRVGHASDTPQWLPCSGKEGPTGWQAIPLATTAKGAVDGRLSTWSEVGRETVFEFDGPSTLEAARLIWRDLGLDVTRGVRPGPYRYRLDVRTDGKWRTWIDASANETDLYVDYREGTEVTAEAVRLTVLGAPKGITPALTEFTVFGTRVFGAPGHLRVERLENPVGVETRTPRFGWWLGEGFVRQKGYRILVASSAEKLAVDEGDLWDSGDVESPQSVDVVYGGRPLGDSARAWWKVKVFEWVGKSMVHSPWSEPAMFACGTSDWTAKWIGGRDTDPDAGAPAFVKRFTADAPVRRATLHICGLGFYEASLNGTRIGDRRLDPPYTAYSKRVLYSTYLLDGQVREGENELRVLLGKGWFDCPPSGVWKNHMALWRARPRLLAQLELEYADGRTARVVTDGSWREVGNPVRFDCVRKGETVAPPPEIDRPAAEVDAPAGHLVAATLPPTRIVREVRPKRVVNFPDGTATVDFGEDLAGWARVTLRGLGAGAEATFRYDELCNADLTPLAATNRHIACYSRKMLATGELVPDWENFQLDRFVSAGESVETFEPRFTPKGFRYLHVTGLASPLGEGDATAVVLSTDFPKTGSFTCSSPDFNDILAMADRAYRSNFVNGYPTDCPHREKNGWTGDANLAAETAQYVYENTSAYEHWLREAAAEANPVTGRLASIVPGSGRWGIKEDGGTGPIWDGVLVRLPWELRRYRADETLFAELEPAMCRYADDYEQFIEADGDMHVGYGDWSPAKSRVNSSITTVAYFTQICDILGKTELAAYLRKRAVANHYRGKGVWDKGEQTALACALNYGLVPPGERAVTEAELVESVHRADDHIDFGLCGSKEVFRALSEAGRTDLAFKMATQRTHPSFLHWRDQGGTAFWEAWDGHNSRNHVMFCDVVCWAYQYLAGIRNVQWGFKRFDLKPETIDALDHVSARVETPYGVVESSWRRENGRLVGEFTVPPNTAARITFAGKARTYAAGHYVIVEDLPSAGASFNDGWTADGEPVTLPHCWNVDDGADGPVDLKAWNHDSVAGTGYRRQKVTYRRALPPMNPGKRYYLRIHAASIHAVVALDGAELARHDGAFTAFTVPIPRSARESQVLSITVDNFYDPDVPPICGDFTMYGGLYRGVEWIEADPSRRFVAADGLFEDELAMPAGLPKYEMRADGFYVDGAKTFLKGVCCHQDREGKGWAISAEDEEEDIRLIKAMGANAIRTSHYPRSERFYDLCDKYGLYVWTEIPLVDATTASAAFRSNTLQVAREMVLQHRRHKCIAMWGVFNELYLKKMPDGQAEPLVREVRELIRSLDPRPIVAASNNPGKRDLNAISDALGFNMYPGWYGGKSTDLGREIEGWRTANGRSCVAVSEYGAGGSLGQPMPSPDFRPQPDGTCHPVDYQLRHHQASWAAIKANPHVWGCFVWEMFDSSADARHEGARNGINDKGLVGFDHRTLKPSYEFYRRAWNGK